MMKSENKKPAGTNAKSRRPKQTAPAVDIAHSPPDRRACAQLLANLPRLTTDAAGKIDYLNSPTSLLKQLAGDSALTVEIFNRGVAAIGNLIALAAPEIDDGSVAPETVESLGWFLAEIGDFSALLLALSANCRCGADGLA